LYSDNNHNNNKYVQERARARIRADIRGARPTEKRIKTINIVCRPDGEQAVAL